MCAIIGLISLAPNIIANAVAYVIVLFTFKEVIAPDIDLLTLLVLATAKALSNCLNPDSTFFTKLESSTKFNGNEALNSFLGKILKALIYITAAFIILKDFGYDLGGLATGLDLT